MTIHKRGQISAEYLVLMGFVTFLIMGILGVAFFYVNDIRDKLKINQLDGFANKVISGSQTVYYAGPPSRATILVYMPLGVNTVQFVGNELVFNISTSTGYNVKSYVSNVNLAVNVDTSEGVKKILLTAKDDGSGVSVVRV